MELTFVGTKTHGGREVATTTIKNSLDFCNVNCMADYFTRTIDNLFR